MCFWLVTVMGVGGEDLLIEKWIDKPIEEISV